MSLVQRDRDLELDTLDRVGRVAQEPSFAHTVTARLDEVEAIGGPDGGGVWSSLEAFKETLDEFVDAPAWACIGLALLAAELAAGTRDPDTALEVRLLVEEAMARAAGAAHLMRGAIALLEEL